MQDIFKETAQNIRTIRDLVETEKLEDEEQYPLDSFRYNQGFIGDLLKELDDCTENCRIL